MLTFNPTPHCCDKPLENDWPEIVCEKCGTRYNADDITGVMLDISASGKRPVGDCSDMVRTRA